jgi:hypothetical protein
MARRGKKTHRGTKASNADCATLSADTAPCLCEIGYGVYQWPQFLMLLTMH